MYALSVFYFPGSWNNGIDRTFLYFHLCTFTQKLCHQVLISKIHIFTAVNQMLLSIQMQPQ